ncbi:uncharacterized protein BDW70DRAFT_143898 [Aspergillus foveolatus]|uniref:uncharacterized protein n=1 Tax=Aspergillus foveolatus TaxID=210207 RepID=UPI003CCE48D5
MTSQGPSRPRFYRNLQNLGEKSVLTLTNLRQKHSTLSISDSKSQSSTHSSDIARYQNENPSPSSSANTNKRASSHTISVALDRIHSSSSQAKSRLSVAVPSMLASLSHSAAPATPNNPTSSLLTLNRHIETQSVQARHLFTQKSHLLSQNEREWIEATISDTEDAIREVLKLTETFRVDQELNNGRVGMKAQLRWLVRDSRRAKDERERLMLCHASLMGVLGSLQSLHPPNDAKVGFVQDATRPHEREGESERGTVGGLSEPSEPVPVYGLSASNTSPRPKSPVWDLSVQLQDAGMEVAVTEPALLPPNPPVSAATHSARISTVKLPTQSEEEIAREKLDDELLDMLSWRWAQGRQSQ